MKMSNNTVEKIVKGLIVTGTTVVGAILASCIKAKPEEDQNLFADEQPDGTTVIEMEPTEKAVVEATE